MGLGDTEPRRSKKHQGRYRGFAYHRLMPRNLELLPILRDIRRLGGNISLAVLAKRSGWSRFHFHRAFSRMVGETPKQYILRLRLGRAAGELVATDNSILAISRAVGFQSHEAFTRAFRRQFGRAPKEYRIHAMTGASKRTRARHRGIVDIAGPCIRLYHFPTTPAPRRSSMSLLSIERKEVAPMPFLFVRRQSSRSELSQTLAECFGVVFPHCLKAGLEMAGFPLARYPVMGPGLVTVEGGVPLVNPAVAVGEMQYCELPGGPVAFAVHGGPYDQLGDTHAAIERWIQEKGLRVAGPHWEWYVTDPGEHPDPADWRTHIYYPLEK
jgi:AraC family transcriptional regulator